MREDISPPDPDNFLILCVYLYPWKSFSKHKQHAHIALLPLITTFLLSSPFNVSILDAVAIDCRRLQKITNSSGDDDYVDRSEEEAKKVRKIEM